MATVKYCIDTWYLLSENRGPVCPRCGAGSGGKAEDNTTETCLGCLLRSSTSPTYVSFDSPLEVYVWRRGGFPQYEDL